MKNGGAKFYLDSKFNWPFGLDEELKNKVEGRPKSFNARVHVDSQGSRQLKLVASRAFQRWSSIFIVVKLTDSKLSQACEDVKQG